MKLESVTPRLTKTRHLKVTQRMHMRMCEHSVPTAPPLRQPTPIHSSANKHRLFSLDGLQETKASVTGAATAGRAHTHTHAEPLLSLPGEWHRRFSASGGGNPPIMTFQGQLSRAAPPLHGAGDAKSTQHPEKMGGTATTTPLPSSDVSLARSLFLTLSLSLSPSCILYLLRTRKRPCMCRRPKLVYKLIIKSIFWSSRWKL